MLDIDVFAVDPKKVNEGTWVEFAGARFKLARFSNKRADAARSSFRANFYTKLSNYAKLSDAEKDSLQDELDNAAIRVFCDHVLLDWEHVGQKDKEIEFTPDAAYDILSNPVYVDLFRFLESRSQEQDRYSAEQEEAIVQDVKTSAGS